jgi:hypothetical protein
MLSCVFVDFFYCNLQRQKNKRDYWCDHVLLIIFMEPATAKEQ